MLFRVLCLLTIISYFHVQCYLAVPSIYRKAELALRRYSSNKNHNPVVYSLLNILIHDKRAKAFTSASAIEKSLVDVKQFNENDEPILRELIQQTKNSKQPAKLTAPLKADLESVLDTFFTNQTTDSYESFELPSSKTKT